MSKVILPACYMPPASYFMHILEHKNSAIYIEQYEHFPKQTYRSRTSIYGANGKLDLIIPIKKSVEGRKKIKDTRISYEEDWQRIHWLSLQSAYRSSTYFEFYEDRFESFFTKKYPLLMDFNISLTELLCELLKIDFEYKLTDNYQDHQGDILDLRTQMSPKTKSVLIPKPYYQVFSEKYGYIENLSIVDLLFNHGPHAIEKLRLD